MRGKGARSDGFGWLTAALREGHERCRKDPQGGACGNFKPRRKTAAMRKTYSGSMIYHCSRTPFGSGVIEAACKHVIKQRAAISGARWKRKALQTVLSLRALHLSSDRWEQFWQQCARVGY